MNTINELKNACARAAKLAELNGCQFYVQQFGKFHFEVAIFEGELSGRVVYVTSRTIN